MRFLGPYTSSVFTEDCNTAKNDMQHCVQRLGFDTATSTPHWKVRNSWSADWSEAGLIKLPHGVKACSIVSEAVLPSDVLLKRLPPSCRRSVLSRWSLDARLTVMTLCCRFVKVTKDEHEYHDVAHIGSTTTSSHTEHCSGQLLPVTHI